MKYSRKAHEQAAVDNIVAHMRDKPMLPKVLSRGSNLSYDHPDQLVAVCSVTEAIGAGNMRLASTIVDNAAAIVSENGAVNGRKLSETLEFVREIGPKDAIEAVLAVQMAAVHDATIRAAQRLKLATTIDQQDSASTMFNKLARTFTAQVEALKKHRSAGDQTVRVEHVHVYDGGQEVVGNVHPGGGGGTKLGVQPHEALGSNAASSQVQGHVETDQRALPSAGSARLECLPLPRGKGRSANGAGERRLAPRAAR